MAKRIESLYVTEYKLLTKEFFILELTGKIKLPEILPGQFVQVKVENSPATFLRRPFSVHDVDLDKNCIRILVQIAGKGTEALSRLKTGDMLDIIYPLGNSFSLPEKGMKPLLIGGGCGIAPLLFLGKYLKLNGFNPDILLGFRSAERVIEFEEYRQIGEVYITTEDGSLGEKGFVSGHSILSRNSYGIVYCCGPDAMMKAVAKYSKSKNIQCEVSLENLMGCGIGACLCCIVETDRGNLCTCTDGPVFNIKELKW